MKMKNQITKKLLLLMILFSLSALSAGCGNTGLQFLDDVTDTVCCFSPALIAPVGLLAVLLARRS